mmetsp:Transcript_76461/g.144019  ORF Transcript_76461/g.144019 Transcript_76461/m.144019 type:complete len:588 (+) Transcript_76461:109-1872(+)
MARRWEVAGGEETGGILVRLGEDLKSPAAANRLECGSNVEQIELKGQRLHYKLLTGTGPKEGWVSLKLKGKDLLVEKVESRSGSKKASENVGIDKMIARHHAEANFSALYQYDEKKSMLGEGGFATVFEALHKGTKDKRAVKKISFRRQSELEALDSELKILIKLDHPNIMKFYEYFQEPKLIYLVTELCIGGTFVSYFEGSMWDAEDARILFKDVVSAVHYCHTNNVLHRDIKPENCLIDEPDGRPVAKVIDFGVSKIMQSSKKTEDAEHERTGTPFYRAPEVIDSNASYGPKSDMFSVGVMLFLCLTGTHPLHGSSFHGAAIGCEENPQMYDFDDGPLEDEDVAEKPRDLIFKLMEKDKNKRFSAHDALGHPWLEPPTTKKFKKSGKSTRMRESCGGLSAEVVKGMTAQKRVQKEAEIILKRATNFKSLDSFHAAILRLIAHHSHASEVASLREHFARVDTDQSGTVDKGELKTSMKASGMDVSEEDLAEIFDALDTHGKGEIRYSEWIAATMKPDIVKAESSVNEVWCFFDTDNSGEISFDEIKAVLGPDVAQQCMDKAGKKSLTKKCFQEYMNLLAEEAKEAA